MANEHIKFLEGRLERLRGTSTRRRVTPSSSSTLLSAGVRPKVSRSGSSNTPDGSGPGTPVRVVATPFEEDENSAVLAETASSALRMLVEVGKGKSPDRADECLHRLGDLFKRCPKLYSRFEGDIVRAVVPFLSDASSFQRRAAAYRVLRYSLDRRTWGCMIGAGIEWVIVR